MNKSQNKIINTCVCLYSIKDNLIIQQERIIKKGFDQEDGLFVKALDKALCSFNVERQAYYGGTFIGNHVHRALKVSLTTYLNFNYEYYIAREYQDVM